MIGYLRYCLSRVGARSVRKPAKPVDPVTWPGAPVRQDMYKFGRLQRRIRQVFQREGVRVLHINELVQLLRGLASAKRQNLVSTLLTMERIGDVTLTRRNGEICNVRLFDDSRIVV